MTRFLILGCMCLAQLAAISTTVWSAEAILIDTRVTAVTVFPSGAAVTRTGSVSIGPESSQLEIRDLPEGVDGSSVRVEYAGAAGKVISVESRKVYQTAPVREEEQALRVEIETYEAQRRELSDQISAARLQLDLVKQVGSTAIRPPNDPKSSTSTVLSGEALQGLFQTIGTNANTALTTIRQAEQKITVVDRDINRVKKTIRQMQGGQEGTTTVVINVHANRSVNGQIELSYHVPGASWQPIYDARLDSEAGKIELAARAVIRQSTGEDWGNVSVALSTTRPTSRTEPPHLDTWYVDFFQPQLKRKGISGGADYRSMPEAAAPGEAFGFADAAEPDADDFKVEEVVSEFAAEYQIPGRVNVPSDNAPHTFLIAEYALDAALSATVVPRYASEVYLMASSTYEGASPLLPGKVAIFRDGSFVGEGRSPLIRPSETIDLGFGIDDRIKVDYQQTESARSDTGISFINKRKRHERGYVVKVENLHGREIEIAVVDRLPVPRDEDIEVELLPASTEPTAQDLEDRKGVLEWRYAYTGGETKEISFGYAVSHPEDRVITDFR